MAPQLTGRAQQAYAAIPAEEAKDYNHLKAAILRRYDVNEETYRQRFRNATKKKDESHRELITRLEDLRRKWMRECTTVEQVGDLIVMEQFLNSLPGDIKIWVRERGPKTPREAGELADQYSQARKTGTAHTPVGSSRSRDKMWSESKY